MFIRLLVEASGERQLYGDLVHDITEAITGGTNFIGSLLVEKYGSNSDWSAMTHNGLSVIYREDPYSGAYSQFALNLSVAAQSHLSMIYKHTSFNKGDAVPTLPTVNFSCRGDPSGKWLGEGTGVYVNIYVDSHTIAVIPSQQNFMPTEGCGFIHCIFKPNYTFFDENDLFTRNILWRVGPGSRRYDPNSVLEPERVTRAGVEVMSIDNRGRDCRLMSSGAKLTDPVSSRSRIYNHYGTPLVGMDVYMPGDYSGVIGPVESYWPEESGIIISPRLPTGNQTGEVMNLAGMDYFVYATDFDPTLSTGRPIHVNPLYGGEIDKIFYICIPMG